MWAEIILKKENILENVFMEIITSKNILTVVACKVVNVLTKYFKYSQIGEKIG